MKGWGKNIYVFYYEIHMIRHGIVTLKKSIVKYFSTVYKKMSTYFTVTYLHDSAGKHSHLD